MSEPREVDPVVRSYPHRWFGFFGHDGTPLSHAFIDAQWRPHDHAASLHAT